MILLLRIPRATLLLKEDKQTRFFTLNTYVAHA